MPLTPGRWFTTTVQTDQDEDSWDNNIWAPPTPEDIAAEQSPEGKEQGFLAEPALVAYVENPEDARLFMAATALRDACLALVAGTCGPSSWPAPP